MSLHGKSRWHDCFPLYKRNGSREAKQLDQSYCKDSSQGHCFGLPTTIKASYVCKKWLVVVENCKNWMQK